MRIKSIKGLLGNLDKDKDGKISQKEALTPHDKIGKINPMLASYARHGMGGRKHITTNEERVIRARKKAREAKLTKPKTQVDLFKKANKTYMKEKYIFYVD